MVSLNALVSGCAPTCGVGTISRTVVRFVLTSVLLCGVVPAVAHAESYTKQTVDIVVHVGPGQATSCTVGADLYRPAGATPAHPDPAVLLTNGFGGSKEGLTYLGSQLAEHGYVALAYSGLGFPDSGCDISVDTPLYDGLAASQLVTFLGGGLAASDGTTVNYVTKQKVAPNGQQYKYDPRVGMIGGSYAGEVQFAAADVDPRIDTIVPQITWNDLTYAAAPNNANLPADSVTNPNPGVAKTAGFVGAFLGDAAVTNAGTSPGTCGDILAIFCPPLTQVLTSGYPDPASTSVLETASVDSYISHIHIPVMLMQGENDYLFKFSEAVATYEQLRAQGTPVKLVWQSWGHSLGTPSPGELGFIAGQTALTDANGTPTYEGSLILQWFDHYLKGNPEKPALDFSFFRPWVRYTGEATPAYGSAPTYPLVRTPTEFDLSGTNSLLPASAPVTTGTASFVTPPLGAPTSTGETGLSFSTVGSPGPPAHDVAGTYAEWTSAPLSTETDVVGIPSVSLHISDPTAQGQTNPANQLTVFAKLYDISPSGTVTLPNSLVSAARIGDFSQNIHITLPGIVYRFAAGDRLAVVIAATDAEYATATTKVPQTVSITTSPNDPGVLSLPVAPADSQISPAIFAGDPVAKIQSPRVVHATGVARFNVRWSGTDLGGGGLVRYQVQQRINHLTWRTVLTTTARSRRRSGTPRSLFQFRVRAVDIGGNWSAWSAPTTTRITKQM